MCKPVRLASSGSSPTPAPPTIPSWSLVRARCQELRQWPLPSCQHRSGQQRPHQHTWPATAPPATICPPGPPPSPQPLWHCEPKVWHQNCGQLGATSRITVPVKSESLEPWVLTTRKFQDHQVLEHFSCQDQECLELSNFRNAAFCHKRSKPRKWI